MTSAPPALPGSNPACGASASRLSFIAFTEERLLSTKTQNPAPRLRASSPSAPEPEKRSSIFPPSTEPPNISKIALRTLSRVGLMPPGALIILLLNAPLVMRILRLELRFFGKLAPDHLLELPVSGLLEFRIAVYQLECLLACYLQLLYISHEVSVAQFRKSVLPSPEELARATQLQIFLGDVKSARRTYDRL